MTCVRFSDKKMSGILRVDPSSGPFRITVGDKRWWFEWSERWGPLCVTKGGGAANQPGARSPFWTATCIWARQGKRVNAENALWHQPPPAVHYVQRINKRNSLLLRVEELEGYDPDYSEIHTVEVAASVDTHPEGGDVKQAPFMGSAVAATSGETPEPGSRGPDNG